MPYWIHSTPPQYDDEGQRPCTCAGRCREGTNVLTVAGGREHQPAWSFGPFCRSDRQLVLDTLKALPLHHAELGARLGDKGTTQGPKVSGSKASPVPLNLAFDELREEMLAVVASWTGRVWHAARLAGPPLDWSLSDRSKYGAPLVANPGPMMARMCASIARHLNDLLGLAVEPMTRFMPVADADLLPAGTLVRRDYDTGYAEAIMQLSGAEAGLEVIDLADRARSLLGHTGKPQPLSGRCRECEQIDVLRRPDSTTGLADYAECTNCGSKFFGRSYEEIVEDPYCEQASWPSERMAG